jgi:hypothetical protein
MLEDILKIIRRDGYLSRSKLAKELKVNAGIIDDGIEQLIRMGYLVEEKIGEGCPTSCALCPLAKGCNKEALKTFKLSPKGVNYLERDSHNTGRANRE